jgi:hypothetical protein
MGFFVSVCRVADPTCAEGRTAALQPFTGWHRGRLGHSLRRTNRGRNRGELSRGRQTGVARGGAGLRHPRPCEHNPHAQYAQPPEGCPGFVWQSWLGARMTSSPTSSTAIQTRFAKSRSSSAPPGAFPGNRWESSWRRCAGWGSSRRKPASIYGRRAVVRTCCGRCAYGFLTVDGVAAEIDVNRVSVVPGFTEVQSCADGGLTSTAVAQAGGLQGRWRPPAPRRPSVDRDHLPFPAAAGCRHG